jgi:hypothetical protein
MAGVICLVCKEANPEGEALCVGCGFLLAEVVGIPAKDSRSEATIATDTASSAAEPARASDGRCPACEAAIPDPANLVCVECLEPLTPDHAKELVSVSSCAEVPLRLYFSGQPVDIPLADTVLLGRDPDKSPVAALFANHDNVSRRHASVGAEPDGTAWVRDEHSANGTFVNDKRVPSGGTLPLMHGDQLRMASNVVAQVEFGHRPE